MYGASRPFARATGRCAGRRRLGVGRQRLAGHGGHAAVSAAVTGHDAGEQRTAHREVVGAAARSRAGALTARIATLSCRCRSRGASRPFAMAQRDGRPLERRGQAACRASRGATAVMSCQAIGVVPGAEQQAGVADDPPVAVVEGDDERLRRDRRPVDVARAELGQVAGAPSARRRRGCPSNDSRATAWTPTTRSGSLGERGQAETGRRRRRGRGEAGQLEADRLARARLHEPAMDEEVDPVGAMDPGAQLEAGLADAAGLLADGGEQRASRSRADGWPGRPAATPTGRDTRAGGRRSARPSRRPRPGRRASARNRSAPG